MARPDWYVWALGIAEAVAERGDCTRSRVGAIILDTDHRDVGTGYNGAPPGIRGCLDGGCPRGQHYPWGPGTCACGLEWPCPESSPTGISYDNCIALHAEVNAVVDAGRRAAKGGTMIVTRAPCYGCIKVIQAAGIVKVVYPEEGTLQVIDWPFDGTRSGP